MRLPESIIRQYPRSHPLRRLHERQQPRAQSTQEVGELLIAAWVLSGRGAEREFPLHDNLMDRALYWTVRNGSVPRTAAGRLHFGGAADSTYCVELEQILAQACHRRLLARHPESPGILEVIATPQVANGILRRVQVNHADAVRWGRMLRDAVTSLRRRLPDAAPPTTSDPGPSV